MKILSPFGPKIAKLKIPKKIVDNINHEVEKIITNKQKSKSNDYSMHVVGEVNSEIKLNKNFINRKLKKFLHNKVKQYLYRIQKNKVKKFKIKNVWVVRQFKNEYNPVHFHTGSISGVGYLKVPKNLTLSKKNSKTNGTIDFINGSKSFLNNTIHNHKPKIGDLILFPNNLMHTAYPFNVNGERRSFSFNIDLRTSKNR